MIGLKGGMIPRAIHQLWIPPEGQQRELPDDTLRQVAAWKTMHLGFEHTIWTIDDVLSVLPTEASSRLEPLLAVCRFESMKADLTRLFLLFHQGGFWIDLKLYPLCSFLDEHTTSDLMLVEHFPSEFIPDPSGVLVNGIFGCSRGNPFIGACLERATANVRRRMSTTVWEVTGPNVFMEVAAEISSVAMPSTSVWGKLIEVGSASFSSDAAHWSAREQRETMYLDTATYADAVPIWRTAFRNSA
jgi:mannosyltransferase OCH1-like enzyme